MGLDWWLEVTLAVNDDECCPEKLVPCVVVLGNVFREDRVERLHDCRVAGVPAMLQAEIDLGEVAAESKSGQPSSEILSVPCISLTHRAPRLQGQSTSRAGRLYCDTKTLFNCNAKYSNSRSDNTVYNVTLAAYMSVSTQILELPLMCRNGATRHPWQQ